MAIAGPKAPTPPAPPSRPSVDGVDDSSNMPVSDDSQGQQQEGNPNYGIHITLGNHGITISPGQTDSAEGGGENSGSVSEEMPQKNIGTAEKTIVNKNQEQQPSDAEKILGADGLQPPAAAAETQVQQNTDNMPLTQPSIADVSYWPFIIVFAAAFISFFIINMTRKSGAAVKKRKTRSKAGSNTVSADIMDGNYNVEKAVKARTDARSYGAENAANRVDDREIKEERPRFEVRI